MVTPAGLVKVLDFGLAKAEEPPAGGDPMESPTATLSRTRAGIILGTAAYMSPEQASGQIADRRADIWSFGAVLFEMLSGQRAFVGESTSDTLASVLKLEPDWNMLPVETPVSIRRLIRRCLTKDRKQRLQAIGEARIEIQAAIAEKSASESATIVSLIKRHTKVAIGSIAVVAAMVPLTWFLFHRPAKPSAELTQKRLTFNSNENPVQSEAISPDGKYLAYTDPSGIHVELLVTREDRIIPTPAGVSPGASWSVNSWFPDSAQLLADVSETDGHKSIWTVSVLGQTPRQLREDAEGFQVSPDGTHIAFRPQTSDDVREIWVMGSQGDKPLKILAVAEDERLDAVHWSPDGQRLAFIRYWHRSDRSQYTIETCDLNGARRTMVVSADLFLNDFAWLRDGRIVYARQDSLDTGDVNLWQIGIDNHAGTPAGKPKRITQWPGYELLSLSASADGKRLGLLKATDLGQVYLGELSVGGTQLRPPRRLTNDEFSNSPTAWTADSKAVLFSSGRNPVGIYKQGINQETSEPVVTETQDAEYPRLSPDGAWILFVETPLATASLDPPQRIDAHPANGGASQFVLETRHFNDFECARAPASLCVIRETSQDRKQLLITAFDPLKGRGKVLRTIETGTIHTDSAFSPDGSTFAVSRTGEAQIHIRLLSLSGGPDREITVKGWPGLTNLTWSIDGKGLLLWDSNATRKYASLRRSEGKCAGPVGV